MIFHEKSIKSEQIFDGKILSVRVDTVAMPDGRTATREIVDHSGGVCVVPITENNEVIMVRQFRKPLEAAILEIPAGKLNKGEDHYECGVRELEEETGYKSNNIAYLGHIFPTPGFANETIHIYLATELYKGEANLDLDEYLVVEKIPLDTVVDMIMNNEINDSKTVVGILKAREYLWKSEK
ncbi:MAG: NUDIX hydrolase [Oscillospiraceae bacterium]|nr:NUDIX hydrolase [Oscillospiraceae bacterium]